MIRIYLMLDIAAGKASEAARLLRTHRGVTTADMLEGPPDVIMTLEAPDRQLLAKLTLQALASVDAMTTGVRLLPVCPKDSINLLQPRKSKVKKESIKQLAFSR